MKFQILLKLLSFQQKAVHPTLTWMSGKTCSSSHFLVVSADFSIMLKLKKLRMTLLSQLLIVHTSFSQAMIQFGVELLSKATSCMVIKFKTVKFLS